MENNMNVTLDSINAIRSKKEEKKQFEKPVSQNAFDEKNYLDTRLKVKEGELTKEVKIRLLPVDETGAPYKTVYMHTLHTNNKKISESGFKNYICLKKTDCIDHEKFGEKCPFCEAEKEAWNKYNEAEKAGDSAAMDLWKQTAGSYKAREYAIIRCIDRDNEADGPKFWKIRVNSKKEDALNKILALVDARCNESIEEKYGKDFLKKSDEEKRAQFAADGFEPFNIWDIYTGKDLKITFEAVKDTNGKLTNQTSVQVIDYGSSKPISKDENQIKAWITDSKKWNDVFAVKPYEYLQIVLDGGSPYFNKVENKWVAWDDNFKSNKERSAEEANAAIEQSVAQATQPVQQQPQTNVRMQEVSVDDLPF